MPPHPRPIRFVAFEPDQEFTAPVRHAANQRSDQLPLGFDQLSDCNGLFSHFFDAIAVFIGEVFDPTRQRFAHGAVVVEKTNDKSLAQFVRQPLLIGKEAADIAEVAGVLAVQRGDEGRRDLSGRGTTSAKS